ncbi:MAG: OmpA family protein [Bacteroidales bacterium]|nr:OmpA family protein [Bacteroidales bacterium]
MKTDKDYQQRLPEHQEYLLEEHYESEVEPVAPAAAPVAKRGAGWLSLLGWGVAAFVAVGVMFAGVSLAERHGAEVEGRMLSAANQSARGNASLQYVAVTGTNTNGQASAGTAVNGVTANGRTAQNATALRAQNYVYYFANDNSSIPDNKVLNELAGNVAGTDAEITVTGYADPTGNAAYNQRLSQRRADNVARYLVAHGVAADHIKTVGAGQTDRYGDYARDRRAEIHVDY